MDIQYSYHKRRSEFGRECHFKDWGPELIDDFAKREQKLRFANPIDQSTQHIIVQGVHEVNTPRAEYKNTGVLHAEGGWPKDVNVQDEEAVKRYRRKIEKEETYAPLMLNLIDKMEECILQNNSVNIYQSYFEDCEQISVHQQETSAKVICTYQQPTDDKKDDVTSISWSTDYKKIAVSYCNLKYQAKIAHPNQACIWDVNIPNAPLHFLKPTFTTAVSMEFHPKDLQCLVSGHLSGKIAIWDLRKGNGPIDVTKYEVSHRDPVSNVLWITSKTGTEFFSSSTDGYCKWWDVRKLSEPLEMLLIAPVQNPSEAMGITCMEYDTSVPTRFMIGTEQGIVMTCNRKGKNVSEKLGTKFNAHLGPVMGLQRNPGFSKNFLSVGDWSVKIFSEECKESPIIWSNYHAAKFNDCSWSPTRFSVFFCSRSDGNFDIWDILHQQSKAVLSKKLSDNALTKIRTHEGGKLVAVGDSNGGIYMIGLSGNLYECDKSDKMLLTSMIERETRREKILESRNREIRLRWKAKYAQAINAEEKMSDEDLILTSKKKLALVEQEYYEMVEEERKKINSMGEGSRIDAHRDRDP